MASPVLTTLELEAHNLVCPAGGITACDNGGGCGLCLLEVPPSLRSNCPYGSTLSHCSPGNVEFGEFCEAAGGHGHLEYTCGTHKHVNSCFGGFDTYVNVFCAGVAPQAPPPPPTPPSPLPRLPPPPQLPRPSLPGAHTLPAEPSSAAGTTTHILVAACIPAGFLILFVLAVLCYCVVRRRSTTRVEEEHRDYHAKLRSVSSEFNASVLFAVKSLATRAHAPHASALELAGVEMPTASTTARQAGARGGDADECCSVCMDAFKEGERLKVLPCQHVFHETCIDKWLLGKGRAPPTPSSPLPGLPTCPLCKAVPIEVPAPALPPAPRTSPVRPARQMATTAS